MKDPKLKAERVVTGIWETEMVMLDFDNVPLDWVKYWCFRAWSWFKLGGFIIFESSRKELTIKARGKFIFYLIKANYHAIFDRPVRWKSNVRIMNWVALESGYPKLQEYIRMQCIKGSSTIRISGKGDKPSPKLIYHYGSKDRQIKKFLETRDFILRGVE